MLAAVLSAIALGSIGMLYMVDGLILFVGKHLLCIEVYMLFGPMGIMSRVNIKYLYLFFHQNKFVKMVAFELTIGYIRTLAAAM